MSALLDLLDLLEQRDRWCLERRIAFSSNTNLIVNLMLSFAAGEGEIPGVAVRVDVLRLLRWATELPDTRPATAANLREYRRRLRTVA